jgi:hypothetical protein
MKHNPRAKCDESFLFHRLFVFFYPLRTGVGEREVLTHCTDTRRVPFGVGNVLVVSRVMTKGF